MALLSNPTLTGLPSNRDSSLVSDVYSELTVGVLVDTLLRKDQRDASDVDGSGAINSSDATLILAYLDYLYNEGSLDYESWITADQPRYDN